MKHIIILPYFDREEISRYVKLAGVFRRFHSNRVKYEFLLTAGRNVSPDPSLVSLYSSIAPSRSYHCQTEITGYPLGSSAMFWETMRQIDRNYSKDGAFSLWFESDMIPVKDRWIDMLDREWRDHEDLLVMGRYVPKQFMKSIRSMVPRHINGGACYSKKYYSSIPKKLREEPVFDVWPYELIRKTGRYRKSDLIQFGHLFSLTELVKSEKYAILHGYLQDKNQFLDETIARLENPEFSNSQIQRKIELCCRSAVRRGAIVKCPLHFPENQNWIDNCRNQALYLRRCIGVLIKRTAPGLFRLYDLLIKGRG